jgi:hypothetical protein
MKSKLIIIAAILFITNNVFSQEKIEKRESVRFNHSLGFGAGISTGYGMSYRYFGKKLGAQVNFSPYKDENKVNISSGLTFLYRIVELEEWSFYVYQGNHFYYDKDTSTDYNYMNDESVTQTIETKYVNNGVGLGAEYATTERLSFNGMLGYGGQENFEKISITVEVAVYFKF